MALSTTRKKSHKQSIYFNWYTHCYTFCKQLILWHISLTVYFICSLIRRSEQHLRHWCITAAVWRKLQHTEQSGPVTKTDVTATLQILCWFPVHRESAYKAFHRGPHACHGISGVGNWLLICRNNIRKKGASGWTMYGLQLED